MATKTDPHSYFATRHGIFSYCCYYVIVSIVIAVATMDVTRAQECPSRCRSCQGGLADCQRRSLTAPPKFYPPDTRIIDLRGNHIRVLGSRTFRRHQTAEVLKIANNKVTALRNDAFRNFPDLMSMELTGNKISRIYPRALAGMSRLQTLTLNRNRIRRLADIFAGTPGLHQLNLASNRITQLQENDLAPLVSVRYLDLRENSITRIHPRAFHQLRSLRYLFLNNNPIGMALNLQFSSTVLQLVDISNCQLPTVPQTLPSSVSDLRLGRNKIMQINHTDFQNINDLQMLALNENELHFLADGTFTHLTGLKEIWLRGNNLVYVPRDIPANVEKLYMDSNRIREIEPGLFPPNSRLEHFSAENNQINRVHPRTFTGMSGLKTISLQGNQLQAMEAHSFSNLASLDTLLLSNNPLQRLEADAFYNLPNLTRLHLSYFTPETMELQGNFLSAMPRLHELQIMASPGMAQALVDMVGGTNARDVSVMSSLTSLDLSYNNLFGVSSRLRAFFPNARSVLLDGNPFNCNEALRWLQEWMASSEVTFHRSEELMCQNPLSLRGRPLQSLTAREWREGGVASDRRQATQPGRPRQKRKHDESSYQEIQGAGQSNTQTDRRQSNQSSVRSRSSSSPSNADNTRQPSQEVTRALAVRAQRENRRRKSRTRSKSRSRKGGKRRGNRRGRRKGRKNGRRKGSKRADRKSRVKRNDEAE